MPVKRKAKTEKNIAKTMCSGPTPICTKTYLQLQSLYKKCVDAITWHVIILCFFIFIMYVYIYSFILFFDLVTD